MICDRTPRQRHEKKRKALEIQNDLYDRRELKKGGRLNGNSNKLGNVT